MANKYQWFYFRLSWYITLPPFVLHFLGYVTPDWVYINDCEKRGLFVSCNTSSCCIDSNGSCGGIGYANNSVCSNGEIYCVNNSTGCSVDELDSVIVPSVFGLEAAALLIQLMYFVLFAIECCQYGEDFEDDEQRSVYEIIGPPIGMCFTPFLHLMCCFDESVLDNPKMSDRLFMTFAGIMHILPGILILAGCSHLMVLFPGYSFGYSFYLSISSMLYNVLAVIVGTLMAYFIKFKAEKTRKICGCQVGRDYKKRDKRRPTKRIQQKKSSFFRWAKNMTTNSKVDKEVKTV